MAKITPKVCPKSTVLPSFLWCFRFLCPVFLLVAFIPSKYRNKHMSHQKNSGVQVPNCVLKTYRHGLNKSQNKTADSPFVFTRFCWSSGFVSFISKAMPCNLVATCKSWPCSSNSPVGHWELSWAQNLSHILREPQHTPGAYPRPAQTPKWKEFLHKLLVLGLGYVPEVCWKIIGHIDGTKITFNGLHGAWF